MSVSTNPDDPPYPTPWAWRMGEVVRLEAASMVAHARARAAADPQEVFAWRLLGDDLARCASFIHEGVAADEILANRRSHRLSLSASPTDLSGMNTRPDHVLTAVPSPKGWEGQCKCGWSATGTDVLDQWQAHERAAQGGS